MKLNDIFLLYSRHLPEEYEIRDTSRGDDDFRQTVLASWRDRKLAVKICCNDFTTPRRIDSWQNTIQAYRALGFYCPAIVKNLSGAYAAEVEYNGKKCVVFAEEFSRYKTAAQHGRGRYKPGERYVYHEDAIRFIGLVGAKRLQTADFPSGICLMERFCPSDPCDEIMETALDFKNQIGIHQPQYAVRFQKIWDRFMENKRKLERIYPQLPRSVYQADLNETNILLDDGLRFAGVLDFNLCGYDTTLNCLFRESFTDFYEDVPWDREKNVFYDEKINERALQSFLYNIRLMNEVYVFSQAEKEAAALLYRYLRPFWWQPLLALSNDKDDAHKVERILTWIEKEQERQIPFCEIMSETEEDEKRAGSR